jgi:hypothetical protein
LAKGIVLLPARLWRGDKERSALRQGIGVAPSPGRPLRVLPDGGADAAVYCAACAGPIEFGPVIRGLEAYCSVECSLGGDRPA